MHNLMNRWSERTSLCAKLTWPELEAHSPTEQRATSTNERSYKVWQRVSSIKELWDFGEPMEVDVFTNWLPGSRS